MDSAMLRMTSLSVAVLLAAVSPVSSAGGRQRTLHQATGIDKDATGSETSMQSATVAGSNVDVEDLIQRAIQVLDRLDTSDESDNAQALLNEARSCIETIRASEPANPWLAYLQGRVLARMGRQGDAVEQLRRFVDTREGRNEWRAYRLLGDLFAGQYPHLAKANYEKARVLNPGAPDVLIGLSQCVARLGALQEAISLAQEAVAADGKRTVRYVSHMAKLLKAAGRWKEARQEAEYALGLAREEARANPGALTPLLVVDAQYQLLIEITQTYLSDPQAHASGAAGTAVKPDLGSEYRKLATYLRERARITRLLMLHDVVAALKAGVDATSPNTPPGLLEEYGIALAEVGRNEAAVEVFSKLLSSDPENSVAKEWLSRLRPHQPADTDRSQAP